MPPIRSAALRGAITLTMLAVACQDSPVEPPARGPQPQPVPLVPSPVRAFSGRAADSVMSVYESRWATASGTTPRQARLAWRKRNGVPDSVSDSTVSPPRLGPSLDIVGGEGGGTKPAPIVMSHYEQLYFGRYGIVNTPPGVEAQMTFIGDVGEIQLGNITITRKDGGAPFKTSGRIAAGSGQILSCADVMVNQCGNSKHLSGALLLTGAPVCDASGNGNVNYSANNLASSLG